MHRAVREGAGAAQPRGRPRRLWRTARRVKRLVRGPASGPFGVFAVRIAGAALGYALHVTLARLLGTAEFGAWGLAFTLMLVAGHAASLGFSETVVRYLTGYLARGEWGLARGQVISGACVSLGAGAVLGAACAGLIFLARDLLPAAAPLMMAAAILPVFALQDWMDGAARALDRPLLATVPIFILRPVVIMAGATIAASTTDSLDAALAMGATVAAVLATTVLQAIALWRALPPQLRAARAEFAFNGWLRASAPLGFVALADQAGAFSDVIALGLLASPEETGAYFAAARIVALVGLGTYAVSAISGRTFALHHARGETQALHDHVRATTRWTFLGSLCLLLVLAPSGPLLLSLFGRDFVSAAPALAILSIGLLVHAAAGQAEELLVVLGRQRASLRISVTCAFVRMASCFAAAAFAGVIGVAIAIALCAALRSFLFVRAARRLVGIDTAIGGDTFRGSR